MKKLTLLILTVFIMSCGKEEEVTPDYDKEHNVINPDYTGCWVAENSYTLCIDEFYGLTYKEINMFVGTGYIQNDTLFYDNGNGFLYWFDRKVSVLEYNYIDSGKNPVIYTKE